MRIDKVYIKKFKNLIEFDIDIDENQWENIFLGQNATGKSNFFEALVLIFKNLDLKKEPPFDFKIIYTCKAKKIIVEAISQKYEFEVWESKDGIDWIDKRILSRAEFERRKEELLPNHVFIYYSGTSDRLQNVYIEHQRNYYLDIIRDESKNKRIDTLRRIFLVQNIHSKFAILSFFIFSDQKEKVLKFLKEELGILDLHSLLLVLKKPIWSKSSSDKEMFWNSSGLVRSFLEQLWSFSLAPIYNKETTQVGYKKSEVQDRLYLFVEDKKKLADLATEYYKTGIQFFNALESTHISDLIEDIKVKVEKKTSSDKIPFSEMSEGEQQLLTVLGMLRFLKDRESLILLDEPDTHLNPIWKWKYLEYFRDYVGRDETTQILINTHDPLVIGGLVKEQIRVFRSDEKGKVTALQPDIDPIGLGVAGILTSELFGLATTLDKPTQELLDERNNLIYKESIGELSEDDRSRLTELFLEINSLGFTYTFKDPLYSKFLANVANLDEFKNRKLDKEDIKKQNKSALGILEKLFKKEKDDLRK
ncbi:AAA family ATPase [Pedobacter sp. GR22-6]|uniref:AAA family ATPase n=1 Tax=Pedobacter sp. GR22-6 TaxID=3127957 RepID=UPI00307CE758